MTHFEEHAYLESQFHYGSIQTNLATEISLCGRLSHNSTMVRFKQMREITFLLKDRSGHNSTMVRFKQKVFMDIINCLQFVTIPLWFDSNTGDLKDLEEIVGSQFHYGSIQTIMDIINSIQFGDKSQFHYGSIQTLYEPPFRYSPFSHNSTMVRFKLKYLLVVSNHPTDVTIPLWFDSNKNICI